MKWCVEFPEETLLIVRPCLKRISLDVAPASKLLSDLLYRYSIRKEASEDAQNLNEVKRSKGELADQDISFKIYRKQEQIVIDVCNEFTEKTLHDVAAPTLQLLGFLDVEELPGCNCYTVHLDKVNEALAAYKKGPGELRKFFKSIPQLEKVLIGVQLEKVLINKKYFQLELEKVLIANRNTSNCRRGRKPKLEAASDTISPHPQISIEITKIIEEDNDSGGDVATAHHTPASPSHKSYTPVIPKRIKLIPNEDQPCSVQELSSLQDGDWIIAREFLKGQTRQRGPVKLSQDILVDSVLILVPSRSSGGENAWVPISPERIIAVIHDRHEIALLEDLAEQATDVSCSQWNTGNAPLQTLPDENDSHTQLDFDQEVTHVGTDPDLPRPADQHDGDRVHRGRAGTDAPHAKDSDQDPARSALRTMVAEQQTQPDATSAVHARTASARRSTSDQLDARPGVIPPTSVGVYTPGDAHENQNQSHDTPARVPTRHAHPDQGTPPTATVAEAHQGSVQDAPTQGRAQGKKAVPSVRKPKESVKKPDLLAQTPQEVMAVIVEWQGIFNQPVPVTARLVEHGTTLASYQPMPGEIPACRLWMYQTDTKKWYSTHGMGLGDVVREFERFRSLASVPEIKPLPQSESSVVTGRYSRIPRSSFDDPNYRMDGEFYPEKKAVAHAF
jgi:hypothetical protein